MASRIEHVIRTALHLFGRHNSGVPVNAASLAGDVQQLRRLVSDVSADDVGLSAASGTRPADRYDAKSGVAPVTYVKIFENQCISVGVFIVKDGARIPLHDHQGMFGLLKVLYGDLNIRSYTCLSGTTSDYSIGQRLVARVEAPATLSSKDSAALLMPKEQNLHELRPVKGSSAAFLDILAPPYMQDGNDCFYYEDLGSSGDGGGEATDLRVLQRIQCSRDFWCDSLPYRGPDVSHLYQS